MELHPPRVARPPSWWGGGPPPLVPAQSPLPEDSQMLHVEHRRPMHNLLSLAQFPSVTTSPPRCSYARPGGSWNLPQEPANAASQWPRAAGLCRCRGVSWMAAVLTRKPSDQRCCGGSVCCAWRGIFASVTWASMAVAASGAALRNLTRAPASDGRSMEDRNPHRGGVRSVGLLNTSGRPPFYVRPDLQRSAGHPHTIGQVLRQVQIVQASASRLRLA